MSTRSIAIAWADGPGQGIVAIQRGRLAGGKWAGRGRVRRGGAFFAEPGQPARLELRLVQVSLGQGAPASLVTIRTAGHTFTFFLRDVSAEHPILIPVGGVAVTVGSDRRTFAEIAAAIRARGMSSELDRIAHEPEESFEAAAAATRKLQCQTWLGLSRDIRIFAVEPSDRHSIVVDPKRHGKFMQDPDSAIGTAPAPNARFDICFGRGVAAVADQKRWLDENVLPILHLQVSDGPVQYHATSFVTWEKSPLRMDTVRGTHYAVAHAFGGGCMFTPEQAAERDALIPGETDVRMEQPVLAVRVVAVNNDASPRHAFFRAPQYARNMYQYDGRYGTSSFTSGRVFGVTLLDGKPMPQSEVAVLLAPGQHITCDILLPHQAVNAKRGRALVRLQVDKRLEECRGFWRRKLASAARLRLPEARIDQMARAGLLHLDVVAYGKEPKGPVAACIGTYSPIGSESSPIIQFMDSMGWHDLAARSLQFFLERQHDTGFIQSFGGYMLETGPTLWSIGEHWRYTRDLTWAKRITPKVLKSCEFLLDWRRRNCREDLRGKGYGLIEGKVADPEDHFRQFMLNGTAYLGLSRAAEMLRSIDPAASRRLAREAAGWKRDIRDTVAQVTAESPVIPLGDGTWAPTTPPWAEMRGYACQYVDGQPAWTHGAFNARDSLIGPLYLILGEVIDANEPLGDAMVRTHQVLATVRNAAMSQPYYTRHDLAHLQRGEVKAFLKTYYNQVASLADRETYTFWEHFFGASPHKTHEEGWFLMQTRWMLWMEEGDGLRLLRAVPRAWLADGQEIAMEEVASYFGPLTVRVQSEVNRGRITAEITCDAKRAPAWATIRLPHPAGLRATGCRGGQYDAASETVKVTGLKHPIQVELMF